MLETLVLNTAGTPISIVPYRKVLTRVWNHTAIVLKSYEGTIIKSAGDFFLPIPSVVQCDRVHYTPRFTKTLPFTRMNVYLRDKGHCMYCGKKVGLNSFSFDHYIPKCQGGRTSWENILICCLRCNSKKGNKPASKFKEPIRRPYAPQLDKAAPVHLVNKLAAEIPVKSWQDFIYWSVLLQD